MWTEQYNNTISSHDETILYYYIRVPRSEIEHAYIFVGFTRAECHQQIVRY